MPAPSPAIYDPATKTKQTTAEITPSAQKIIPDMTIYNATYTIHILDAADGDSKKAICKARGKALKKQAAEVFGDDLIYGSKNERIKQDIAEQNKSKVGELNISKEALIRQNPEIRYSEPVKVISPIKNTNISNKDDFSQTNILSNSRSGPFQPLRPIRPYRPSHRETSDSRYVHNPNRPVLRGGKKNISLSKSTLKKINKAIENATINNNNALQDMKENLKIIEKRSIKIPKKKTLRKKIFAKHNKTQRKYS